MLAAEVCFLVAQAELRGLSLLLITAYFVVASLPLAVADSERAAVEKP